MKNNLLTEVKKKTRFGYFDDLIRLSKTPQLSTADFENVDEIIVENEDLYHFIKWCICTGIIKVNKLLIRNCEERCNESYNYDNKGNLTTQIINQGGGVTRLYEEREFCFKTTTCSIDNISIRYYYDENNNLISQTIYFENGDILSDHKSVFDKNNNKIKSTSFFVIPGYANKIVVSDMEYDERGNLTKTISSNGRNRSYEYDDKNNKIKETNLNTGNIKINVYDEKGNRISSSNKDTGKITYYEYDENGILIDESLSGFDLTGFEITYKQ